MQTLPNNKSVFPWDIMSLTLSQLSANLQEIYYEALKDDKKIDLVPSLFSNQLYSATSWMGRLWRFIIAIIGFFVGDQFKRGKLNALLKKIGQSFQEFENEIAPIFNCYQTLIAELTEGYTDSSIRLKNIRYQINNWNKNIRPFTKLLDSVHGEKIRNTFYEALGESCFSKKNKAIKIDYHPLISLEEKYGDFIPYAPLAKLSMKKPLTRKEETDVEEWINWVESNDEIKQRKLHKALKAVVETFRMFNTSLVTKPASLPGLEIALIKKGLNRLLKEDPKHVEWRKTLNPGKEILINGTLYKLGQEIVSKKDGSNNNRVFICSERTVIVIGKNLATLRIRKKAQKDSSSALYNPKWIDVDKEGVAGVQEKMVKHISYPEWKSNQSFNDEDLPLIRPIFGLLKFMNEINRTPQKISYEHMFYNEEGVLTTVKPSYYSDFNYALLEEFAFKASKKNVHIFKYIIEESKHINHAHARYFEDIIDFFVKKDTLDAQTIATLSKHSITTPCTVDSGILLQQKVKALYEEVKKDLYRDYSVENKKYLRKVLRIHIQRHHISSAARSFFYPKSKELLIEKIVDDMRLALLEPHSRQNADIDIPCDI